MSGLSNEPTKLSLKDEVNPSLNPLLFSPEESAASKDSKIWNAFRNGSRDAFDYIFKHYASQLFAYGSQFTKDNELVLDCIQDLFVELWNRRQNISETTSIKFYLLRSLRRRIARTLQGIKRFETISEEFSYLEDKINFSAEHLIVLQEANRSKKASLRKAVQELTKRQREAIYLKFYQGLNNSAIASVMDLSESSVMTLVSQAIRALRLSIA